MSNLALTTTAALTTALIGILALNWWLNTPAPDLPKRVPGLDKPLYPVKKTTAVPQPDSLKNGGIFRQFNGKPGITRSSWPHFRGPDDDNIAHDSVKLAATWPASGPPQLWSLKLGEGYAGPAIRNGRVYILDYDEKLPGSVLRCFSFNDGQELWQRGYRGKVKRNHGMSRTVPAVDERFVVTIGPKCRVMCVKARSGDFLWGLDLPARYGTRVPLWYTGQCPLIRNGVAILAPAGKEILMMGVDCQTGKILWTTPNSNAWNMSHSSIIPMTFFQQKALVYCAIGGMIAVVADGPNAGKVLWRTREWTQSVVSPSPVALPGNRLFVTAGYGGGGALFQVNRKSDGTLNVQLVYRTRPETFACEQQTPIFYRGRLFSILPADGGALQRQLVCFDPEQKKIIWNSGKKYRFGLGPFLLADDKLFVLNDNGILTLFSATAANTEILATAKILHGRDAWAPLALVDGKLLLRDWKRLVCLDVSATPKSKNK